MSRAAADVDAFLAAQGLPVRRESSSRAQLIDALVAIRATIGSRFSAAALAWYSDAVRDLARNEVEASDELGREAAGAAAGAAPGPSQVELEAMLEGIVYGTVLFEPVLLAFRRLWHERYAEEIGLGDRIQG
jgi:hypothetical protein